MTKEEMIERNNKIDNRVSAHWEEQKEIRKQMVEAIHDMVSEMGGVKVDWETDDDYPTIIYDGGRHPEYNSTISACVNGVNATKNKYDDTKSFSVDLEDEANYDQDRMEFCDVAQVFEFVCGKYEDWLQDMADMADDVLHEFK
jgi:hypothetical protein